MLRLALFAIVVGFLDGSDKIQPRPGLNGPSMARSSLRRHPDGWSIGLEFCLAKQQLAGVDGHFNKIR